MTDQYIHIDRVKIYLTQINTPRTYQVHIVFPASMLDSTKGPLGLLEHNLMTRSLDL